MPAKFNLCKDFDEASNNDKPKKIELGFCSGSRRGN
jgi:hypothetical protein